MLAHLSFIIILAQLTALCVALPPWIPLLGDKEADRAQLTNVVAIIHDPAPGVDNVRADYQFEVTEYTEGRERNSVCRMSVDSVDDMKGSQAFCINAAPFITSDGAIVIPPQYEPLFKHDGSDWGVLPQKITMGVSFKAASSYTDFRVNFESMGKLSRPILLTSHNWKCYSSEVRKTRMCLWRVEEEGKYEVKPYAWKEVVQL